MCNLDEMRISDWEDRKSKKVMAPQSMRGSTIHHRVNLELKYVSVVACVSTAGESLTPYIVTSQDSPGLQDKLKKRGVRFGMDCILKSRAKHMSIQKSSRNMS
jgi:hypothetical protein